MTLGMFEIFTGGVDVEGPGMFDIFPGGGDGEGPGGWGIEGGRGWEDDEAARPGLFPNWFPNIGRKEWMRR